MPEDVTRCTISIDAGSDADEEERVDLTRHLRQGLLTLSEVERVESASIAAPPGSKAVPIDLQSIIVTLAASGGVLTTLIGFIQSWLTRREKGSVTVEIGGDKLTIVGPSSDAESRLIRDWVNRHKT